jgi:hypothetical protein
MATESELRTLKKQMRAGLARTQLLPVAVQSVLDRLDTTFRSYEPKKVKQAIKEYNRDGEVEIDEGAVCSRGEDSGCYVQAWVGVYD